MLAACRDNSTAHYFGRLVHFHTGVEFSDKARKQYRN